jgi:1-aminocyclopropane-1-carboxylate deaminase/D-cysteine desulfhydrase-like pyridoxal-dependent ACC family enzyme
MIQLVKTAAVLDRCLEALARLKLNPATTPLLPARALGDELGGPDLWFKRDDLIAFGFGGNKVRGLEFIVADALEQGADTLVTGAGPLSNHVRATAAAAAHRGLRMVAVYWGEPPAKAQGNHRLTELLGAEIRFTGDPDRASVDRALDEVAGLLRDAGARPYVIPRGGACALGVIGHVDAAREVAAQCQAAGVAPDVVLLAVGSGATLAGWLLGAKLFGLSWRVEGVTVSRPASEVRQRVVALAREAAESLRCDSGVELGDVIVHDGFIGAGYGVPSLEGRAAIVLAARTEAVFLDPVYTGKAMAAYRALLSAGRYGGVKTVVFVHTGGLPSLFVD